MARIRLCIFTLLLFSGICLAQGVRFGDSLPVQSTATVPGVSSKVLVAIPNATVNFCAAPANAVPCTNKATTFTDATLTISCPSSSQVVLAGTNNCVSTTDTSGNWGVWVKSGAYQYTVTVNGVSSGPFEATPGGSGTGGVSCTLGPVSVPWFNGTLTLCDPNLTDDGAGTFGVATLNASAAINTPQISLNGNAGFLIGPFQKQTAPANPATGQMTCWGDSGTNFFACKNSDGSNAMPSGGGGSLTVQTNGVSNTSQTTLNFNNPATFNGLTFTYSNPSSGNETFTVGGTLNVAGLTNSSTTVNGQPCALGGSCTITGSAPVAALGSSDTISAAGTFATQLTLSNSGFGVGTFIEINANGIYTTTTTASPLIALQVNAGGTIALCPEIGNLQPQTNVTAGPWNLRCLIQIATTGAPGTAWAWGTDFASGSSGGSPIFKLLGNGATAAFTTTSSQTVSIQETATMAAGQTITLQNFTVRSY
jgi:hypothetical protein